MAESEEELKSLLMRVKEDNEKAGLKFNTQKTNIMASGPITLWQIGEKVETVSDFIFLAPESIWMVTTANKIKRRLLLGRKDMTNLNSVLESRDITLMTKVHIVKSSGFSNSHVWV